MTTGNIFTGDVLTFEEYARRLWTWLNEIISEGGIDYNTAQTIFSNAAEKARPVFASFDPNVRPFERPEPGALEALPMFAEITGGKHFNQYFRVPEGIPVTPLEVESYVPTPTPDRPLGLTGAQDIFAEELEAAQLSPAQRAFYENRFPWLLAQFEREQPGAREAFLRRRREPIQSLQEEAGFGLEEIGRIEGDISRLITREAEARKAGDEERADRIGRSVERSERLLGEAEGAHRPTIGRQQALAGEAEATDGFAGPIQREIDPLRRYFQRFPWMTEFFKLPQSQRPFSGTTRFRPRTRTLNF